MSSNITQQLHFFLVCVATGAGMEIVYDVLRICRRVNRHKYSRVGVEDMIYWMMMSLITFWMVCVENQGEIRAYGIAGLVIGFLCFRTWISPVTVEFFSKIFIKVDKSAKKCGYRLKKGLKKLIETVKIMLYKQ